MTVGVTTRQYRRNPAETSAAIPFERHGRATFAVQRNSRTLVHITVAGDVDASNGRALAAYVERNTGLSQKLLLDLSSVKFFGTLGFTALCYIRAHSRDNDADWVIVGSRPVRRLLSICDPEGRLPLSNRYDPLTTIS
jgi:anti-anti-sigma factor